MSYFRTWGRFVGFLFFRLKCFLHPVQAHFRYYATCHIQAHLLLMKLQILKVKFRQVDKNIGSLVH